MSPSLTAIYRFPVKSCRGEAVASARVQPWGLDGDRRWMLVDDAGQAITAREVNRLVLIHPELTATGLRVSAPDAVPLEVVTPDAIWIIDQTPERTATLFACTPPGSTSHRLVVHLALAA